MNCQRLLEAKRASVVQVGNMKNFKMTVSKKPFDLKRLDYIEPTELLQEEDQEVKFTAVLSIKEVLAVVYLLNSWVEAGGEETE